MERSSVIQQVLDLFANPKYLEIGVFDGNTFFALKAGYKVAVDPLFQFDITDARRANRGSAFHQAASDKFFSEYDRSLGKFDVVYLDGLHTFEQTLRDFTNAIDVLQPNGVIIVDDVLPHTYQASLGSMDLAFQVGDYFGNGDRAWMGDVYRLVFFIETFFPSWSYATVKENHGQLITWRSPRPSVPERTVEGVGRLPYEAVVTAGSSYNQQPMAEILNKLRQR